MAESLGALPYIAAWLPENRMAAADVLAVAGLFALHPQPGGTGNLADSLRRAEISEHRVGHLLATHRDDLLHPLRHAVTLCRSRNVPIDWHQLYRDLRGWSHPDAYVQTRWARAYWGSGSE
jgi:CRISPR system Cascade subunit CasB